MIAKRLSTQASLEGVLVGIEIAVSYEIEEVVDVESIADKIVIGSSISYVEKLKLSDLSDIDNVYTLSTSDYRNYVEVVAKRSFPTIKIVSLHLTIPYQVLIEDYEYRLGRRTIQLRGEVYYQPRWTSDDYLPKLRRKLVRYLKRWQPSNCVNDALKVVHVEQKPVKPFDCGCAIVFEKRIIINNYEATIDKIFQYKVEKYKATTNKLVLYLLMGIFAFMWLEIWEGFYNRSIKTKGRTCFQVHHIFCLASIWGALYCTLIFVIASITAHYVPWLSYICVALSFSLAGHIVGWLSVIVCSF